MVACQVAHSLFNVPTKIARIRAQSYRQPHWQNLFSREHMPIDVIVSPEAEVAKAVSMRLSIPGTNFVAPMSGKKAYLCSVICEDNCPLVNTPIKQISSLFPDLNFKILTITNNGKSFIPGPDDQMFMWDEAYFLVDAEHIDRVLSAFGHEEKEAQNVILVGGGNIGKALLGEFSKKQKDLRIKIIEADAQQALKLSENYDDLIVLEADGLDKRVMKEANIAEADVMISVTNDDETNILSSLIALQAGCERVIPLVNKTIYNELTASLGLGSVISPRAITVSSIMSHVRRGRVKAIHNVANSFAEVIEVEVSESCTVMDKSVQDINLPKGVIVAGIIRDEELIVPDEDSILLPNDLVIMLAEREHVQQVEKMFSAQVELF
ncbi:MAG: Trk system potassium transporter TrkA, partial [Pseudomonadota bacterium]